MFNPSDKIRPAECAGDWYPAKASDLSQMVDSLLNKATPPKLNGKPIALIGPHAGYQYSAAVSAAGYKCLIGQTYRRVIVMAFSHRMAGTYRGLEVSADLTAYQTPLGDVPIDRSACDQLLKNSLFTSNPSVAQSEHSLELQIPFLQQTIKDFKLVPIYVGKMSTNDYTEAAKAIVGLLDDETLLVVSSDFTHYGSRFGYEPFKDNIPTRLTELANQAAAPLLVADYDGFAAHLEKTDDTICGRGPIQLLLRILSMLGGAEGTRTAMDNSGQQMNDWTTSVTYQSFVYTRRQGTLTETERHESLKLARQTVTAQLKGEKLPAVDANNLSSGLQNKGACFVTLQNHGRLRGCIGNMEASGPFYDSILHNAVAACKDYRFVDNPVTTTELPDIDIEISYLTPMKQISNVSEIIVGRHGLYMSREYRSGVLLPQVAYERGWTREQFLSETCRKAGLAADDWKKPDTKIYTFEAQVFGEKE